MLFFLERIQMKAKLEMREVVEPFRNLEILFNYEATIRQ